MDLEKAFTISALVDEINHAKDCLKYIEQRKGLLRFSSSIKGEDFIISNHNLIDCITQSIKDYISDKKELIKDM